MVSEETGAFIKEHLEKCLECTAEREAMKAGTKVEKIGSKMQNYLDTEVLKPMKAIRKRFRKKASIDQWLYRLLQPKQLVGKNLLLELTGNTSLANIVSYMGTHIKCVKMYGCPYIPFFDNVGYTNI